MTLDKYTVRIGLRHDNPAWPVYCVFIGNIEIGRSFSVPDLGCCVWLHRQMIDKTGYAFSSAPLPQLSVTTGEPGTKPKRSARYFHRKRGRPSSAKTRQDIAKALAGG